MSTIRIDPAVRVQLAHVTRYEQDDIEHSVRIWMVDHFECDILDKDQITALATFMGDDDLAKAVATWP